MSSVRGKDGELSVWYLSDHNWIGIGVSCSHDHLLKGLGGAHSARRLETTERLTTRGSLGQLLVCGLPVSQRTNEDSNQAVTSRV